MAARKTAKAKPEANTDATDLENAIRQNAMTAKQAMLWMGWTEERLLEARNASGKIIERRPGIMSLAK